MVTYAVEYYKRNVMIGDSKPYGPYRLDVDAKNLDEAVKLFTRLPLRDGSDDYNLWNAEITHPEKRLLLRNGVWLIDTGTGKLLEEKTKD